MKTPAFALSLLLLATGAPLVAQKTDAVAGTKALIEQLGDADFAARQAAEKQLLELGEKALDELEDVARNHADPEVKWRARRLVRKIEGRGKEPRGLAKREARAPERGDSSARRRQGRGFDDVFESLERSLDRGGVDDSAREEIRRSMQQLRESLRGMRRGFDFDLDFDRAFAKDFDAQVQRSGQGRSMKMTNGPDGVRVEITETDKDGNKKTQVYEAEDMEAFNKKHPGVLDRGGMKLDFGRLEAPPFVRLEEMEKRFGRGFHGLVPRVLRDGSGRVRVEAEAEPEIGAPKAEGRKLGFYYGELAPAVRDYLGLGDGVGLMVESVEPGSLAEKLSLRRGDIVTRVGKTEIRSAADVSRGLGDLEDGEVTVEVLRRGRELVLRAGHELPREKSAEKGDEKPADKKLRRR